MNKNEIKLQKNNSNRDWSDLEWIQEFHSFLQGDIPEGISLGDEYKVKLTPEQSSTVIWYLQEHFPILPDSIEMCDVCKRLYDSYSEGCHYEIEGKNFVEHVKMKVRLHIAIIVCLICGNQRVEMKIQGFISARNARRIRSN